VRVVVDGVVRTGRAVDCRHLPVDGAALAAAVRADSPVGDRTPPDGVAVDCPPPTAVHGQVGHVHPEMGLSPRAALAAVARVRRREAPQDRALAATERELGSLSPPSADLSGPRERVAGIDEATVAELRERVAARRGAIEAGAADESAREGLRTAAARLADAETDHAAAREALARARAAARAARDVRERRLELQDRADNLRRAAREHLAGDLADEFDRALATVGHAPQGGRPAAYDGDPVPAALAVARLAPVRAPVVVEADRFGAPARAADLLDAPVALV
jgi:hypothetical protein